jgi:hypothetical protein
VRRRIPALRRSAQAWDAGRVQRHATVIALLCGLLVVGGCGGGGGGGEERPAATRTPAAPRPQAPASDPLALPAGIPRSATGPADAGAARTIRRWARALQGGDVARAVSYWALPAKIQNGTPVLTLRSRQDLRLFNGSLACGAVLTGAGAARGYTIATFRLTERPGGDCGGGTGQTARTAVLVRGGRIAAWYRLPDAGTPPGAGTAPDAPII